MTKTGRLAVSGQATRPTYQAQPTLPTPGYGKRTARATPGRLRCRCLAGGRQHDSTSVEEHWRGND
ncbi:hypothetical protein GCM10027290_54470 [Micromonospora sonneratiae]|uniref:Uncharacterized protein n=1 Tax=Micromonospora sonneratiae TaxID=1184706 RepID=A0ABW3YJV2_9ACTN